MTQPYYEFSEDDLYTHTTMIQIDREASFFQILTTVLGVIPCAFFLAFLAAALADYHLFQTDEDRVVTPQEDPIVVYLRKYDIDEATQDNDEEYRVSPDSYVLDYTPEGIIIMKYDYDEEGFKYWSNRRITNYKVLETVARKYVTSYCCKDIYVDRKKELDEKKRIHEEKEKQLKEQEEMKKEDKKENDSDSNSSENSVFASFKSYNKGGKGSVTKVVNKKTNLNVCERSNKFIRQGNVEEFEITQKDHYTIKDARPKLSFEMFKEMFSQQQKQKSEDEGVKNEIVNKIQNDIEDAINNISIDDSNDLSLDSKKDN